jgi:hypothetical protein
MPQGRRANGDGSDQCQQSACQPQDLNGANLATARGRMRLKKRQDGSLAGAIKPPGSFVQQDYD